MPVAEFLLWLGRRLAVWGPALVLATLVVPSADHTPNAVAWIGAAVWAATAVTRRGGRPWSATAGGLAAAYAVVALTALGEALRAVGTGATLLWRPTGRFALAVTALAGGSALVDALILRRRLAARGTDGKAQRAAT